MLFFIFTALKKIFFSTFFFLFEEIFDFPQKKDDYIQVFRKD